MSREALTEVLSSDRPILFFITDTLYVYVPDNRYAEPIFIYCYKVSEVSPFFSFSRLNNNKKTVENENFHVKFNLQITTIKTFYL